MIPDVSWYGPDGSQLDWHQPDLAMIAYIAAPGPAEDPEGLGRDIAMLFNSTGQPRQFCMPEIGRGSQWSLLVDTSADSPHDIYPEADGPAPPSGRKIEMPHHSLKVYVA